MYSMECQTDIFFYIWELEGDSGGGGSGGRARGFGFEKKIYEFKNTK